MMLSVKQLLRSTGRVSIYDAELYQYVECLIIKPLQHDFNVLKRSGYTGI